MKKTLITTNIIIGIFCFFYLANAFAQEAVSLDLKGIDINELFRILSLKMGVTIVPTKSVTGRVNIFLNNLTFEDALDVILISQDLACDKKGDIINIMTATEYQNLYGEKYNEKRKFSSLKLTYAKPSTVFNALGQLKSDIGKVIVDEASGTIFLIDTPERLELMKEKVKDLDRELETDIFYLNFAKAADIKSRLSDAVTPEIGQLIVDERVNKVMICDFPEKVKKIRRLIKHFDKEGRQLFIDAEVIQIILTEEYQKGINWEGIFNNNKTHHKVDISGAFPVAPPFTPSPTLSSDNLTLTAGTLDKDEYTTTMQLLKTFGDTEVIAHQYLSVVEKQEAKITVASREPIVMQAITSQSAGADFVTTIIADKVEFVDVGLKIKVVPEFNETDTVTLNITTEANTLNSILKTEKSYVPIVGKREAATTVKVKDKTTIMVAGLQQYIIERASANPPTLAKMGLLGTEASRIRKTEVLIFLTPYFHGKRDIL